MIKKISERYDLMETCVSIGYKPKAREKLYEYSKKLYDHITHKNNYTLKRILYNLIIKNDNSFMMSKNGKKIICLFVNKIKSFVIYSNDEFYSCSNIEDYHKLGYSLILKK